MTSVTKPLVLSKLAYRGYASSSVASSSRITLHPATRRFQQPLIQLPPRSLIRWNSSQSPLHRNTSSTTSKLPEIVKDDKADALRIDAPLIPGAGPQQVGKIEPRLSITFTCTADECGHRSTHEFSKRSYEKGIVLVQCPECKARHLIADHLGWFKESTDEGNLKTVEDLLRAKGEKVRRGKVNYDGDIEYEVA